MSCSLGIDIGTTTIKVCVVRNSAVLESFSASHNAQVVTSHLFNEQNPEIILGVVDRCLTQLKLIKEVDKICVTGQMHGVLMWEIKDCLEIIESPTLLTLYRNYIHANTNLITWQDQRCGKAFLESLSCSSLSTGFGLASLLWLKNETPNIFNLYHSCGTIMDFVVCLLTRNKKPSMSVHNANSWGYFDMVENRWNFDELKRDLFDCSILPDVVPAGTTIGNLYNRVYGMSSSSIVYVALGDHQCSFRACSAEPTEAVLNIGTSSQLSILVPNHQESMASILEIKVNSPGISITPYDKDFVLITAASLNGGNIFEQFASTISSWCRTIGCSNIPSNQELMEKLLSLPSTENLDCAEDPLIIIPTLYGERHAPNVHASILNISSLNLSLASVTQSLFEGLSRNLCNMLPKNYLVKYGITQIAGTGRCFIESSRFLDAVLRDFDIPWRLVDKTRDASLGTVLFSLDIHKT